MLKHLQKFFAGTPAQPAQAETTQKDVDMTQEELAANAAKQEADAAMLATATEALATLQAQNTELATQLEAAQAALTASESAQTMLATQAAAKRLEARTDTIKAAIGADNAAVGAMLTATEGVSDEQFTVIVSALAASFEAESKTEMFVETGAAAEVVLAAPDVVKSMAAKFAEEFKSK